MKSHYSLAVLTGMSLKNEIPVSQLHWIVAAALVLGTAGNVAWAAQELSVASTDAGRFLRYDGQPLLELSSP